jgi:hypothetical protein
MIETKTAADILALTEKAYEIGKQQVANGQQVSQEDLRTLNRVRTLLAKAKAPVLPTSRSKT